MSEERRPNFDFIEMGIQPGEELVAVSDPSIKITVKDNRKVIYNGREFYLSALEDELELQGNPCINWKYNGKVLNDIYNETYAKKEILSPKKILDAVRNEIEQKYDKQFSIPKNDNERDSWLLIGDSQHLIGDQKYHYEINISNNKAFGHDGKHVFVEFHIGEVSTTKIANVFKDIISSLNNKPEIDLFEWREQISSVRLKKGKEGHSFNEKNLIKTLLKELIELDIIIGPAIREKISEYERPERIKKLIEKYKKLLKMTNNTKFIDDELFKWKYITDCKGLAPLQIINYLFKSNTILLDTSRVIPGWKELLKNNPAGFELTVANLMNETKTLDERILLFENEMKNLFKPYPKFTVYANDERTASCFLSCRYPDKYTFFKPERLYYPLCDELGVEIKDKRSRYKHFLELLNDMLPYIQNDAELQKIINEKTKDYIKSDLLTAQNICHCVFQDKAKEMLGEETMNTKSKELIEYTDLLRNKLNVILQGAPGTGKTYTTASLALSICGEDVDYNDRDAVMERYKQLREDGRIGFCTFHQSMDYEDFIEGIKPKTENGIVTYDIEDGIFKRICDEARNIVSIKKSEKIDFSKTRVFKMSLGDRNEAEEVFSYCLENNVIALGWGEDKDFSNCVKREDFKALDSTWGATAVEIFKTWMQKGDVVLISDRLKGIKAIARIVGDYEYNNSTPLRMCQFRKVEWLYNGELITTNKFYGKRLSQQSIYGFYDSNKIGKPDFNGNLNVDFLNEVITGNVNEEETKPYVLIIDEINRGNVSKIFGELITLMETDKRLGNPQTELTVELPYSKETFGVPKNLYIIGTMNTTDRSTGTLDYAVRRRFSFVTLEAQENVLIETNACEEAKALFKDVKTFIENNKLEDIDIGDLMVGHSYFMTDDTEVLKQKIKYDVIPLVKEYIKDGILTCLTSEAKEYFEDWLELKVHNPQESFE